MEILLDILFGMICLFGGVVVGIILMWNRTDRMVELVSRHMFKGIAERAWKRCDKLEAQLESYNKYDGEDQLVEGPRWWTNKMNALKIEIEVLEKRIERSVAVAKQEE